MRENQETINSWQRANFPKITEEGTLKHLKEEFEEFFSSQHLKETALEAADLVIILYCWAMQHGVDLHAAIDAKMRINRERTWDIQPDGSGRHQRTRGE